VINGAHAIVFSNDPESDRAFFREVLGLGSVDAGGGWLIFALPPSELAVHPAEAGKPSQEIYLTCEDIDRTLRELEGRRITVEQPLYDEPWGRLAFIRLPGGGKLGIYEPRHPRPEHSSR
jgi:predicted enzyme related to lactoylglutathione lyase